MPTTDTPESRLLDQAIAGDRWAMGQLLVLHAAELSRHIAAQLPPSLPPWLCVEDLLHDTFLEAYRSIRQFRTTHEGASFVNWLRRIADHRVLRTIELLRAKKRGRGRPDVPLPCNRTSSMWTLYERLTDADPTPATHATADEAVLALRSHLACLPDAQREAVHRHHLDGASEAETALAMGRSVPAVRGLLHRARANLRQALGRSSRWFYTK